MLTLFDKFLKRQTEDSPTDILVGLICTEILKEPMLIDDMTLGFGGHLTREWAWPDKQLTVSFEIVRDGDGCFASSIRLLHFEREKIELTTAQQKQIIAALNQSQGLAKSRQHIDAQAANENRALDAIAKIMGVA